MKIYPVILAGGSGTRLWPLSREALPKQFLPLLSDKTMLQETVLRTRASPEWMAPLVVCGVEHRFLVIEQLAEIGVTPLAILLEPIARNTAPAAAVAAQYLLKREKDALMLILPADHAVVDVPAFQIAVQQAAIATTSGALVTFGVKPTYPETGYGYIHRGAMLEGIQNCFAIDRFVEKPDRATAEDFLASPDYCWNSGMFLFRASNFLRQLQQFRPDIHQACQSAFRDAYGDLDFYRLDEIAFAGCPNESIDCAVMELTRDAVVMQVSMGWSDVGSWSALGDVHETDADGNILRGDVYVDKVSRSLIRSESRLVAVIGVEDLIVVETKDAVLVMKKNHAQDIRNVVESLKNRKRCEHVTHTKVYRPWGCYEGIDSGHRFQAKRITVKPGGKLSLQMHHHRAEHWVVVSGTARVTCGDEVKLLSENESTYIPIGAKHRLENPGKMPLHLIEVQSGAYLGEDDIVRFEDAYKRK